MKIFLLDAVVRNRRTRRTLARKVYTFHADTLESARRQLVDLGDVVEIFGWHLA